MERYALLAATLVLILVSSAAAGTTRTGASAPASNAIDIEFAADATGSMQPLIQQAQKDAQAIVDAVRAFDPDARFAVVAFRDVRYPMPEYEVLQRFTTDTDAVKAGLGKLKAVGTSDPANVGSEGYNLVFDKSVSDTSLGWRPSSRKVVVVLGDAEPHGAGTVGLRGCKGTASDPHGLNTVGVLARMRAAGRTLLMVHQKDGDSTLECYRSIAALAAPGSAALNSGNADLAGPIRALLDGAAVTLEAAAGFPLALPGSTRTLKFRMQNRTGGRATLELVKLLLPPDTTVLPAVGLAGPKASSRSVSWSRAGDLAPGASRTLAVKVRFGKRAGSRTFRVSTKSTLADGRGLTSTGTSRVRVGRSLAIGIVSATPSTGATGALSFTYPASASSLRGQTSAQGTLQLGDKSPRVKIRFDRARIVTADASATLVAYGVVATSQRASCSQGTAVTVRLVDRDIVKAQSAPDVIRVVGPGCRTQAAGDVITR